MITPTAEVLNQARIDSGLSEEQLWLRYFALGGKASPFEVDGALHEAVEFTRGQLEVLVHALNERFTEIGLNSPVPYPGLES